VAVAETGVGLQIVRELLTSKLEGQLTLLQHSLPRHAPAAHAVERRLQGLQKVDSIGAALALEAKAASTYWARWQELPVQFARIDERKVPKHWLTFGDRHSPLSASPRKAATPASAILNYLYALAEFECRLAALAVGLDPGLGWAHRDTPYRDSAALDLLEALRPAVDEHLLDLLETRTFSRKEFAELPNGQVRLMPNLAHVLATSTLPTWERMASSRAEIVAKILATSATAASVFPGQRLAALGARAVQRWREVPGSPPPSHRGS